MGLVIGVDVGGANIKAGLVDTRTQAVLQRKSVATNCRGTQEEVLAQIVGVVEPLMDSKRKAIGIGVPSIVIDNVPRSVVNIPGLSDAPLATTLQRRVGSLVYVENDAMAFTIGEGHFGVGAEYATPGRTLVGVILGTGLSARVLMGGQPVYGRTHGAGELGESEYLGRKLEHWAAGPFFQREFQTTGEALYAQAKAGDVRAIAAFNQFGDHVGEALARVVQAYDPDAIVLGGSVSNAYDQFQLAMLRSLQGRIYPEMFDGLQILVSQNPDMGILGAAALHLVSK